MTRGRLAAVLLGATALGFSSGCNGGSSTSPSGGGALPTFTVDDGVRFLGIHPAPVTVGGLTYVFVNTADDGTTVQGSPDGLHFAATPAAYPAGVSRTIVTLPDGRYRMYYFPDQTSVEVLSAISTNGIGWVQEFGIRFSDASIGAVRATALPTGGYRLYYPTNTGISSAISVDGLNFVGEGRTLSEPADGTWGPSAVAYVSGRFHMVMTKTPASGISELWHATSNDGRTWVVDRQVLAANPGVPLNQPAWSIDATIPRIYFRAQPSPGVNAISSGTLRF